MKFAIAAVVVLALAMGVQSSVIAGIPGLGLGINHLGLGLGVHGQVLAQGPAVLGLGVHGIPAAVDIAASPLLSAAHIPAAVNIATSPVLSAAHVPAAVNIAPHAAVAAAIPVHGATYVAKTRGAVHTAPLPGHIQSAASVNVAPAPGTW